MHSEGASQPCTSSQEPVDKTTASAARARPSQHDVFAFSATGLSFGKVECPSQNYRPIRLLLMLDEFPRSWKTGIILSKKSLAFFAWGTASKLILIAQRPSPSLYAHYGRDLKQSPLDLPRCNARLHPQPHRKPLNTFSKTHRANPPW